ncbi:MAG: ABC transporter permease [Candidatus Nanopelagicaceae bacterium]|jgi:ABC-2 type transport system permease protein
MKRHNLPTVISFEVLRTFKRRTFWIGTLLVPFAIGAILGLNIISNSLGAKTSESQKDARFTFEYADDSGYVNADIARVFGGRVTSDSEAAIAAVKSGTLDAFFHYPKDPTRDAIQSFGVDKGIFNNGKYGAVAGQILKLSAEQSIGNRTLSTLVINRLDLKSITYKGGKESGNLGDVIPPLLFILIFYFVIVLLGNQMLTSTLEEKENRVTEIILTTLNPTTLITGKILSLFVIGVTQMLVFSLPMVVSFIFFRNDLKIPNLDFSSLHFSFVPMSIGLLILIAGFTLFMGTLVAVGAVMPTAKEAGQIFGVVVTLLFIPFWSLSLVASNPDSLLVRIITFFPYSAPVTAMMRNGLGSLSSAQAFVVIAELFILGALVLRLAVRLFRYGSMEYSKRVSVRAIVSQLRPN